MNHKTMMLMFSLFLLLAGCSSNEKDDSASESQDEKAESKMDASISGNKVQEEAAEKEGMTDERKVIHQAQLELKVKNLEKAQMKIENKVAEYGGYVVESNVYREDEELVEGTITVRVPEAHFQDFLTDSEGEASEVVGRNVTGQDVTEQYVDLKARLKSKRAVEERLLAFMKDAEKTEDLLKISADLAVVQEEIEQLTGQIKYLENQTSYSTVTITLSQDRIVVPGIDNKELNTWERTKKQLATSANLLLKAGSGIIVFIIGNLPILIILGGAGAVVHWVIKRRGKR
ncbi:DUF4349 domain-containing protein [Peribacillus simplex]|uniref:DUF4349 domain-containing protein n=1 Tax=Peribacillus simplex TaxID=1478 RepID=A0AAN2PD81_9BACI|nr:MULTISPECIES: DUF4349 domain-containing protein [Peribacillus]MBD8586613.1 DUF4349 domain-containing protein [Peribacillus simplex]MEA3574190.1 DUF4349 domain-containing protein [Peribacillus frigoritolerans]NCT36287.1 DUF4349 domain-containing protein [Peribacillus frigoritolerans]CEG30450.1 hypothetical protein BN1180_00554 [Peribacillus simplex]